MSKVGDLVWLGETRKFTFRHTRVAETLQQLEMQSYSCREWLGRWTCWRIIQSYGCQLDNHTRGYRQRRKECKKRISKARSQGRQVRGAVLGVSQIPWQEGELQGAGWDVQRHGRRKAMAQCSEVREEKSVSLAGTVLWCCDSGS